MKPYSRLTLVTEFWAFWTFWAAITSLPLGNIQVVAQWTYSINVNEDPVEEDGGDDVDAVYTTYQAECDTVLYGVTRALNQREQLILSRTWSLSYNTRWEDWEDWSRLTDEQWIEWEVANKKDTGNSRTVLLDVIHTDVSLEDYYQPLDGTTQPPSIGRKLVRKSPKKTKYRAHFANLLSCWKCTDNVNLSDDLNRKKIKLRRQDRKLEGEENQAFVNRFCNTLKSSKFEVFSELDNCTSTCLPCVDVSVHEWNALHYPQTENAVPFFNENADRDFQDAESVGFQYSGRTLEGGEVSLEERVSLKSYWQYGKRWYYADPSINNNDGTKCVYRSWYGGPSEYYGRVGDHRGEMSLRPSSTWSDGGKRGSYTGHYLQLVQAQEQKE